MLSLTCEQIYGVSSTQHSHCDKTVKAGFTEDRFDWCCHTSSFAFLSGGFL